MTINNNTNSPTHLRGLSMVETVMAMVMVSVLLVAALNTLGASQLGQKNTSTHTIGNALAQTLMAEIMSQPYEDPDGFAVFGLETTENSANRVGFDDVDDYVNWTKRAPQNRNGNAQQLPAGWERAATVEWVDPGDLTTVVVLDTGVKRIMVTTTYHGSTIVELIAIRTAGPPEDVPPPPPPVICGDATCDAGEDSCNCAADCGVPPALETPGVDCADGLDNDCDGKVDCADLNCSTDMSCRAILIMCGNGLCESGEDCNSCSVDCSSMTNSNPAGNYCCGDGTLQAAEGTGKICDGNP